MNTPLVQGALGAVPVLASLTTTRLAITGKLRASKNMGGVSLVGNRMTGNLQCKEDIPAPTGSSHPAARKEYRCVRLWSRPECPARRGPGFNPDRRPRSTA
jgi:hypothetical protein